MERNFINERTTEGKRLALAKGVKMGRKVGKCGFTNGKMSSKKFCCSFYYNQLHLLLF
jgi:DNA invertase Pin-like site-specific DNA recombinase